MGVPDEKHIDLATPAGLQSRHVLLDTNVYDQHKLNLSANLFLQLRSVIRDFGVQLHINKAIRSEISSHLDGEVGRIAVQVNQLRKASEFLTTRFPKARIAEFRSFDLVPTRARVRAEFARRLKAEFDVRDDPIDDLPVGPILDAYFAGDAPFGSGSKEFPDAIIVAATSRAAAKLGQSIYVVTGDTRMREAVSLHANLIPVASLKDYLAIVAEARSPHLSDRLEQIISTDLFDSRFIDALSETFEQTSFQYEGGVGRDAEVTDAVMLSIDQTADWTAVGSEGSCISFVADVDVEASLTVEYTVEREVEVRYGQDEFGLESETHTFTTEIDERCAGRVFGTWNEATSKFDRLEYLNPIEFGDPTEGFERSQDGRLWK